MLDPKHVRNVAIIAHDGAGKTALTEALLRHNAPSRASTDGSTSRLDADPEETKRNFTVATHITFAEHEGVLLNLLDTAGFSDFLTDADRSMAVCEGGLLLVSAVSGVKRQTERQWQMAAERSLPLLACVNKLDGGRASRNISTARSPAKSGSVRRSRRQSWGADFCPWSPAQRGQASACVTWRKRWSTTCRTPSPAVRSSALEWLAHQPLGPQSLSARPAAKRR